MGRPLFATASGKPVAALRYSEVLPGLLGLGVIASEEKIRSNPGLVKRFVRALNRGLVYSIANPREAARILKKYQPLVNEGVAAQELEIMKFFVATKPTRRFGVGYIDTQKMKATVSVIRNGFKLDRPIRADDIYARGFARVATTTKQR